MPPAAPPPTLHLHADCEGQAALSIAALVCATAYPPPAEQAAAEQAWGAFIHLLEAATGARVALAPHPALRIRRACWRMSALRRAELIEVAAWRLQARRFPALALPVLLDSAARCGRSRDAVFASRGLYLAAGRAVAGRFPPGAQRPSADNVRRLVWRGALPVLHLAAAIRAELDALGLSAWDWPELALRPGARERLARMARHAETWRRAYASAVRAAEAAQVRVVIGTEAA